MFMNILVILFLSLLNQGNFECINSNGLKNNPVFDTLDFTAKVDFITKCCDSIDNDID